MRSVTFTLDDAKFERLKACARLRGSTVDEVLRAAVDGVVEPVGLAQASADENPNQWLLDLADKMESLGPPRPGPRIPIDSPEAKLQAARDIYRDSMNREPNF